MSGFAATKYGNQTVKVLFFSVWYPSSNDAMAGLFVRKHVQTLISQGAEVRVNRIWINADIVQLNVISIKWGLLALMLKSFFGIPYIIVEHWSVYLPSNGSFSRFPIWKKWLTRLIARHASGIYPVSQILEDNMKIHGLTNRVWGRMENVVDDCFYEEGGQSSDGRGKVKLLHVSCFDKRAKNVKGMLRAVRMVADQRKDFSLTLVGSGKDWQSCRDYTESLNFPEGMIEWTGELAPREVSRMMHESDVFLMFSRYENAPVVISESMAAGLPIVSSNAGGVPEMVSEDCGILVDVEDEEAFADAVDYMLDHYKEYDKDRMRELARKYSADAVEQKLMSIYIEYRKRNSRSFILV